MGAILAAILPEYAVSQTTMYLLGMFKTILRKMRKSIAPQHKSLGQTMKVNLVSDRGDDLNTNATRII